MGISRRSPLPRLREERLGWGDTQLKIHLHRLVELELVAVHRGDPAHRHGYELLYDGRGKDGSPFLTGLIDASKLEVRVYDGDRSGLATARSGSGRPSVGGWSASGRGAEIDEISNANTALNDAKRSTDENSRRGSVSGEQSHEQD